MKSNWIIASLNSTLNEIPDVMDISEVADLSEIPDPQAVEGQDIYDLDPHPPRLAAGRVSLSLDDVRKEILAELSLLNPLTGFVVRSQERAEAHTFDTMLKNLLKENSSDPDTLQIVLAAFNAGRKSRGLFVPLQPTLPNKWFRGPG